jgi:UDP-N-acetylglucosamine 2-epimerase (non-hydrolysing)
MRVLSVLGGRPHLIKAESVHAAVVADPGFKHEVVRVALSNRSDYPEDSDFDIPEPADRFRVRGWGTLISALITAYELRKPDVLLLYGDLATTHAALTAALRTDTPFIHVEAGYRSGDSTDAEEFTRILAGRHARCHLSYSRAMAANLEAEGVPSDRVFTVPDPARLTLVRRANLARTTQRRPAHGLVTFHHDETFERPERLSRLVRELVRLASRSPLHLILYDRTRDRLRRAGLLRPILEAPGMSVSGTLNYDAYLVALKGARFVITDSSGVQDDCVTLVTPCVVVRRASPRPLTPPLVKVNDIDGTKWNLVAAVERAIEAPHPPRPCAPRAGELADGVRRAVCRAVRSERGVLDPHQTQVLD